MNQPVRTDSLTTAPLQRSVAGGIATLVLDHQPSRNALSEAMLGALKAEFAAIAEDADIRVVVLTARGPAFSSGHDLKQLTARRADEDRGRAYFADIMRRCADVMLAITHLPQPVIAAVEGTATAAGCQLVATCDLAVAGANAKFCTPGVNIGLFCSTPMVALSRNLGAKHAMEMLLTGDVVSADDAYRFGLVNRVVAPGEAMIAAGAYATKLAAKSKLTLKVGKEAFYRQREMELAAAYRYAEQVMVDNMLARDAEEGIGAFIEKRPPQWLDR